MFAGVWRVLRDDGTLWLNIGDSYAATGKSGGGAQGLKWKIAGADYVGPRGGKWRPAPNGLKPKDLCMMPARLAFALQAAGWYLRSEIVWAKKSCMPESVTDRPTSAHEKIFLLTKQPKYFYDADAVRQPLLTPPSALKARVEAAKKAKIHESIPDEHVANIDRYAATTEAYAPSGANLRNVWHLGPEPFPKLTSPRL